ncbi:alpha-ketoglutarate-dependent dioxygenase alkB homolog 4 [Zophobas morio]|uniref:alpha-ketoglutarate-dependent dioxygenase alkB homolog 4 n=1 Tax=Zophobas morio TaxID=2755281 RepID=UPI0030835DA7
MDKPRPCGCKGCRTCLICEKDYGLGVKNFPLRKDQSYVYCPHCNKAWPGWDFNDYKNHPYHDGEPIDYPGVYIQLDFLTTHEEEELMTGIDGLPWDLSQSGRRKQNFGPKCNFKKNKLKEGSFNGFPKFSKFVQEKFKSVDILKDFYCVEQCSLEYDPKRGASIDPHIDDCWIWGERIVTVNLLSDSVLTMTYNKKSDYYNLDHVGSYPAVLDDKGALNCSGDSYRVKFYEEGKLYPIVRIPMPNRSLLVLYNSPRYDWEHQILREDITERRVCLAYREFTPVYLPGGKKQEEGEKILSKGQNFC